MWQQGQQPPPQQPQMMMHMQQQQPQQMYQHPPGQQPPPGAYGGMMQQAQPPPWAQAGIPPVSAPAPWVQPGAMPQVGGAAPPWTQPGASAPAAGGGPAPWEQQQPPPPVPTMPPADGEYAATIKQLAGYVNKNGADFEKMIRDKQNNNPKFSFLFGGDGYEYYRWCKHAASLNLTDDQIAAQVSAHQATQGMFNGGAQAGGSAPQAPPAQPVMTEAQGSEFKGVLTNLSGAHPMRPPQLSQRLSTHARCRCIARMVQPYELTFCCWNGNRREGLNQGRNENLL